MSSHPSHAVPLEPRPHTVEASPSPEPPTLMTTASPSRRTTVIPHTPRSTTSPGSHAACEGDLYVVNATTGERFHLTVTLQGPFHPLTCVTHASLQRTVRNVLLHPSQSDRSTSKSHTNCSTSAAQDPLEPPPTLLLDGMPLDGSTTETVPNNAVVVVHRGVAVAASQHRPPHRSRTPSQSADGGITVVEMLSDSLPHSTTAASEREVSLHSLRRPSTHTATGAAEAERPAGMVAPAAAATAKSSRDCGTSTKTVQPTVKPSGTSTRLPPRRNAAGAAGGTASSAGKASSGSAKPSEAVTAAAPVSEMRAPPVTPAASAFARSAAAKTTTPPPPPPPAAVNAATSGPSVTFSRTTDKPSASSSPPFPTPVSNSSSSSGGSPHHTRSQRSSPSDEDGYVIRTPSEAVPAKPLGALHDTGISAATVSAPSSIAPLPSLQSMNDTQAPGDDDDEDNSAVVHPSAAQQPPLSATTNVASAAAAGAPNKPATTGTIILPSAASSPSKKANPNQPSSTPPHSFSNNTGNVHETSAGEWDRSKPPPVTVLLASSPPPLSGGSTSRPSTAFTSPAFSQKSPPSSYLCSPPEPPQAPPQQQGGTNGADGDAAEEQEKALRRIFAPAPAMMMVPAATTAPSGTIKTAATSALTASPLASTPNRHPAQTSTRTTTAITSTALFSTPTQTPAQTPDTSCRAARAPTAALTTTTMTTHVGTPKSTALITTKNTNDTFESASLLLPPLPPYDSVPADTQLQRGRRHLDARQAAYDAQKDAIASAASAEQRRLLARLQQHCHSLEKEKKTLLAARLAELRAHESASRLRVLRAAQEDAAAREIDAVRARLGGYRDALLESWLRVLHAHGDRHYAMSTELLQELEGEGERLSLHCVAAVAGYHTQKARLQALQQQRTLKEAEVARLKWEAHVRRCVAEERRGCLRVVARVRPPLRRPWLPEWVLASPEAADFNRGYAVRVPQTTKTTTAATAAASPCVEVVDPARDLRRQYTFSAAYDDATTQQRLFKEQLQPLLEHMCRTGQRVAVLAFGAVGSGKTHTLVGPPPPPPPPPMSKQQKKAQDEAKAKAAAARASSGSRSGGSVLSFASEDDDEDVYSSDGEGGTAQWTSAASGQEKRGGPRLLGVTEVGAPPRRGITRCLDPAEEEREARVLQSLAVAEAAERRQRSSERHAREERRWRRDAGIDLEDGLLPRAVAWLTAHLRDNVKATAANSRGASHVGEPVVESVVFSMYEVYNDHIYDLLPAPPSAADAPPVEDDEDDEAMFTRRRVRSDPSTWPRWNAGWLPPPHIKNSNPEQLTELQMELVPARQDSREATATLSQLQQPTSQPQWRVRASAVEVRSAVDVLQAIQLGMQRRRSAATLRSAQSSRSHLFLRFRVEVQRPSVPEKASTAASKATAPASAAVVSALEAAQGLLTTGGAPPKEDDASRPKGYGFLRASLLPTVSPAGAPTRASASPTTNAGAAAAATTAPTCVTELLFTDFAGSERVELGGTAGDTLKEAQYINASLSAVADVLTALARANPSRGADADSTTSSKGGAAGKTEAAAAAPPASSLVERWGALVSRPGVSLSRSTPVFLQPRFSKLAANGRFRTPPPSSAVTAADGERGLPLRRRVLTLMDTYVAGQSAAQWWRSWRASSTYIPFRTCKTTQLLQSTMGPPCKTLVLACVRPCAVAEVVLPASMQDRKGKRARELALALFDHQAPIMLAEVHSTLVFADRVHAAAQEQSDGDAARA